MIEATSVPGLYFAAAELRIVLLACLGLLFVVGALRKALPLGVEAGVVVTSLSTALLAIYGRASNSGNATYDLAAGFAALSALWYVAIRWIEAPPKRVTAIGTGANNARRLDRFSLRSIVGGHASAMFALTSIGLVVSQPLGVPSLGILVALLTLLAAELIWNLRAGDRRPIALLLLSMVGVGAVVQLGASAAWRSERGVPDRLVIAIVCASIVAVGLSVAPQLIHWLRRRRSWIHSPESLLTEFRPNVSLQLVVLAASVFITAVILAWPTVGFRLPALLCATLATLGVAHHPTRLVAFARVIGCGMIAFSTFVGIRATGFGGEVADVIALQCASLFLLFVSKSWRNQRAIGQALTTVGALFSAATLTLVALSGVTAILVTKLLNGEPISPAHGMMCGALGLIISYWLCGRGNVVRDERPVFAAMIHLLAAGALIVRSQPPMNAISLGFVLIVLLAVRLICTPMPRIVRAAVLTYTGGVVPSLAIVAATIAIAKNPGAVPFAWGVIPIVAIGTGFAVLNRVGLRVRRILQPRPIRRALAVADVSASGTQSRS